MRDTAEAIRAGVRTSLDPVPLYPFRRIGTPPEMHAQLYAGTESRDIVTISGSRSVVLYIHLYARREEDISLMQGKLRWVDGHVVVSHGDAYRIRYYLNTATLIEQPDGILHLASLYDVTYIERAAT